MVSGNPLTFSRDRDIFSLEHENACYSKKKKMEPHTMKLKEKNIFYNCLMCKSCLTECLCTSGKV